MPIETVVFDLGKVLIDWNPKYVYRTIFKTEKEVDWFLEHVCTYPWNVEQDGGRSLKEGTDWLIAKHPKWEKEIRAYYGRWSEMLGEVDMGTRDILRTLIDSKKYKVYALTNWSRETFPIAQARYDVLNWFEGTVVSGEENMHKPQAAIYHKLLDTYHINPKTAVFIDDSVKNVAGAKVVGMQAIHFTSAEQLAKDLKQIGVL